MGLGGFTIGITAFKHIDVEANVDRGAHMVSFVLLIPCLCGGWVMGGVWSPECVVFVCGVVWNGVWWGWVG